MVQELSGNEANKLLSSLKDGQSVANVGFPHGLTWRFRSIDGVEFRSVDLGGPNIFGSWLGRKRFTRCVFYDALLDGIAIWKVDFLACTFKDVTFGERFRGLFKKCSFTDCSFENCLIRDVSFDETPIRRSHIQGGRVSASWRGCTLEQVTAATTMRSSGFTGCTFRDVDFSQTKFVGCGFSDNSGEPLLPNTPDNFLLNPKKLLDMESQLKNRLTPESLTKYRRVAAAMSQVTSDLLVDESMFSEVPRGERAVVMGQLFEQRRSRQSGSR